MLKMKWGNRKETYKTLILANHKFGKNEYVHGRVSGIMDMTCCNKINEDYAIIENEVGIILTVKTTEERYDQFCDTIEKLYPGLCVFGYLSDEDLK